MDSPVGMVWKPDLYRLQQDAPTPKAVTCKKIVEGCPPYYGLNYHGAITQAQAKNLLKLEGEYLIRLSPSSDNFYTLSFRICNKVRHYKLFYDGQHYVLRTRRFNTIEELIADGIVTIYIETNAGPYIQLMHNVSNYEKSPYITLNRMKRESFESCTKLENPDLVQIPDIVEYDKPHLFKSHTFRGFYWCEYCRNFLWGFIAQGVKCEDCGFNAHYRCSEKVPADCCPDLEQLRGVFGVDLTTLVKAHKTVRPFVIDKCIKEIEERGIRVEGIYRVSGYQEEMDNLRLAFDKDGKNADISSVVYDNINVIASILKLYFRLLPIPLVTYSVHPLVIKATEAPQLLDKVINLKAALLNLPPAHYNTLKYLIAHLFRVTQYSEYNKMNAQNLSTIFAPSIMPPPDVKNLGGNIPDICNEIAVVQLLITHKDVIFSEEQITS